MFGSLTSSIVEVVYTASYWNLPSSAPSGKFSLLCPLLLVLLFNRYAEQTVQGLSFSILFIC